MPIMDKIPTNKFRGRRRARTSHKNMNMLTATSTDTKHSQFSIRFWVILLSLIVSVSSSPQTELLRNPTSLASSFNNDARRQMREALEAPISFSSSSSTTTAATAAAATTTTTSGNTLRQNLENEEVVGGSGPAGGRIRRGSFRRHPVHEELPGFSEVLGFGNHGGYRDHRQTAKEEEERDDDANSNVVIEGGSELHLRQGEEGSSFVEGGTEPACWVLSSSTSVDTTVIQEEQQQNSTTPPLEGGGGGGGGTGIDLLTSSRTSTLLDHCPPNAMLDVVVNSTKFPRLELPRGSWAVLPNQKFEVIVSVSGWKEQSRPVTNATKAALVIKLCRIGAIGCNPIAPEFDEEDNSSNQRHHRDLKIRDRPKNDAGGYADDEDYENVVESVKNVSMIDNIAELDGITSFSLQIGSDDELNVPPGSYTFLAYFAIYNTTTEDGTRDRRRIEAISNVPQGRASRIVTFLEEEAAQVSKGARIGVLSLSATALFLVGILFACVLYNIRAQVFELTQGKFILAMQVCGMLACCSLVLLDPKEGTNYCQLQQPLIILPLHVMYAIVLGRMWRIRAVISPLLLLTLEKKEHWTTKIVNSLRSFTDNGALCGYFETDYEERHNKGPKGGKKKKIRRTITDLHLARVIFLFALPQIVMQILMLALHDNKAYIAYPEDFPNGIWTCEYSFYNSALEAIAVALVGLSFVFIVILARASKDLPSLFNETQAILDIAWMSIAIVSAGFLLAFTTRTNPGTEDIQFLVSAYSIGITTMYTCFKITWPKLLVAWSGQQVLVTKLIADHNFQRTERKTGNKYYANYSTETSNYPNTSSSAPSGILPPTHTGGGSEYEAPLAAPTGLLDIQLAAADLNGQVSGFSDSQDDGVKSSRERVGDIDECGPSGSLIDSGRGVEEKRDDGFADDTEDDDSDDLDAISTDSSVIMEVRAISGSMNNSHRSSATWNRFVSFVGSRKGSTGDTGRPIDLSSQHFGASEFGHNSASDVGTIDHPPRSTKNDGEELTTSLHTAMAARRAGRKLQMLARNTLLKAKGNKSHRHLFDGVGHSYNQGRSDVTPNRPQGSFGMASNNIHNGANNSIRPPQPATGPSGAADTRISIFPNLGSGGRGSASQGTETMITYNKKYAGRAQKILVSETDPPGRRLLLRMIDVQRTLLKVNDALMTGLAVDRDDWESLRDSCIDLGDAFKEEVVFAWEPHQLDHPDDHEKLIHEEAGGFGARRKNRPAPESKSVSFNPNLQPEHIHQNQQAGRKAGRKLHLPNIQAHRPGRKSGRKSHMPTSDQGNQPGPKAGRKSHTPNDHVVVHRQSPSTPRKSRKQGRVSNFFNGKRISLPFGLGKDRMERDGDDSNKRTGGSAENYKTEKPDSSRDPPPTPLGPISSQEPHNLPEPLVKDVERTPRTPLAKPARNSHQEYLSTVSESNRSALSADSQSSLIRQVSGGISPLASSTRDTSKRDIFVQGDECSPQRDNSMSGKSVGFQENPSPEISSRSNPNQSPRTGSPSHLEDSNRSTPDRGVRSLAPVLKSSPIRPTNEAGEGQPQLPPRPPL